MFETTIRYLGGLLSAFELSGRNHPVLVQKAKEVADKMAFAWVGVGNIRLSGSIAVLSDWLPNLGQQHTIWVFGFLN